MSKVCNRKEAFEELVTVYNYLEDTAPHVLDSVIENGNYLIRLHYPLQGTAILRYDENSKLFIFD